MTLERIVKEPKCSSCRNGELDRDADVLVSGSLMTGDYGQEPVWMPYRAYLCDDHYELMVSDEILEVKRESWLNK